MTPISDLDRYTIVIGAQNRSVVRLVDGRTARLICWASDRRPTRARIELRPGVAVTLHISQITHIDLTTSNTERENNDH